jgi:hypothetical protein
LHHSLFNRSALVVLLLLCRHSLNLTLALLVDSIGHAGIRMANRSVHVDLQPNVWAGQNGGGGC